MARGRRKNEENHGERRGAPGVTYCPLCCIEAENSAAFRDIHLESRRHKYNFLLATFHENRCVHCPVMFVYCVVICVQYRRLVFVSSSPMKALQSLKNVWNFLPQRHGVTSRKT